MMIMGSRAQLHLYEWKVSVNDHLLEIMMTSDFINKITNVFRLMHPAASHMLEQCLSSDVMLQRCQAEHAGT